jgi:hypothetical protein
MTAVSTIPCENQRPSGVNRVALLAGLALVAWARRSATPSPSREELRLRHESDRALHQLFADRDAARGVPGIR